MHLKLLLTPFAAAAALLLSGCTYALQPVFPEWGEQVQIASNLVCNLIGPDGEPSSDPPQHYMVMTVSQSDGDTKSYRYYFFLNNDNDELGEPAIVSFHYPTAGESDLFIMQQITDDFADYGWFDPQIGEFYYFEDEEAMGADQERIAKEHNVLLDKVTRDYYTGVHGDAVNIRAYLSEIGEYYKGGVNHCEPE